MPGRGQSTRGGRVPRGRGQPARRPETRQDNSTPKRARLSSGEVNAAQDQDQEQEFQDVCAEGGERIQLRLEQPKEQGNVLDFSLPTNMSPCLTDTTGINLSQADKDKVWNGHYVNLHGFLPKTGPQPKKSEVRLEEGKLVTIAETKQIQSIKEWSSAFVNFILVYCEYHTGKYKDLLIYFKLVNYAHDTFGGYGWRTYDELFRAEMSSRPTKPWTEVDSNLWAVHVTRSPSSSFEGARGRGMHNQQKRGTSQKGGGNRPKRLQDHPL